MCAPGTPDSHNLITNYDWDAVAGKFVPDAASITYAIGGYEYFGHLKMDNRSWSLPYMQDRCLDQWNLSPAYFVPNSWVGSDGPGGGFTLMFDVGFNRVTEISLLRILAESRTDIGLPLEMTMYHRNAVDLYRDLSKAARTTSIEIANIKNPFRKEEFSIWYLLVDLVELPRLALSIRDSAKLLKQLRSEAKFKDVADSYLAYQFGLKPTIADISDLIRVLKQWSAHVSTAGDVIGGTYTNIHPVRVLDPSSRSVQCVWSGDGCSVNYGLSLVSSLELHQTTKFYFVSPKLADILSHFKALVDRLGILDPTVLWDVLPWSFVVDWVVDVTGWIHTNLKPELVPADLVVCDWGESLHQNTSITGLITWPGVISQFDKSSTTGVLPLIGTAFSTARKRQFPRPLQVKQVTPLLKPKGSIVTIRRTWLGCALVVQRRKVIPKRLPGKYLRRRPFRLAKDV